jgi:hypothetical protein
VNFRQPFFQALDVKQLISTLERRSIVRRSIVRRHLLLHLLPPLTILLFDQRHDLIVLFGSELLQNRPLLQILRANRCDV